jgi:hypothetical protein
MVEKIPAAVADQAFGDVVLSRASKAGSFGLNAEALHGVDHFPVELWAAIKDQVSGSRVVGECIAQLLNNPGTTRMSGHIAVKDLAAVMRNDEEAIQHVESERRYGKEIHPRDNFTMILQKRRPSLCRLGSPGRSSHPAQDGSLRQIEAKHLQFPMNAWRTPGRVLGNYAKDQFAQFSAGGFSPWLASMSRNPRPIQLDPSPMPTDDSLWLNENQCPPPASPEPPQHHPEQLVRRSKLRRRMLLSENAELLP